MRISLWRKSMYCIFSVLLGPAVLLAYTQAPCQCGKPTPESYKWNFPAEASHLLNQVKQDSLKIQNSADQLEAYDREPMTIDWRAEATLLDNTIPQVRALDRMQCRLRIIKRMTTPDQQATIQRIVPQIMVLTTATNRAVHFLNHNHEYLWAPRYVAYATEIRNSANLINTDLQVPGEFMAMRGTNPQTSKS
jgi:hypothetical protein